MDDDKKLYWSIDKVYNWDKNPRAISSDEFEKLKWKIKKYGQFKPLVITPEGEILGGNMRYRAYKDMNITKVWVSIVTPKDDTEKLEISLADNESAGYYVKDELAELIELNDIDRDLFKLNLDEGNSATEFMKDYDESGADPAEKDLDYKQEFQVVVECADEADQELAYQKLVSLGYKCKVLTL